MYIAGYELGSVVDGPGVRSVVFAQGCSHNCPGCHNLETHAFGVGYDIPENEIARKLIDACPDKARPLITVSGGDPTQQPAALHRLCIELKRLNANANVWVYTGHVWPDIKDLPALRYVDVLVDGPYIAALRTLTTPFVGSLNQRLINVKATLREGRVVLWQSARPELRDSLAGAPLFAWLSVADEGGYHDEKRRGAKEALPQNYRRANASVA